MFDVMETQQAAFVSMIDDGDRDHDALKARIARLEKQTCLSLGSHFYRFSDGAVLLWTLGSLPRVDEDYLEATAFWDVIEIDVYRRVIKVGQPGQRCTVRDFACAINKTYLDVFPKKHPLSHPNFLGLYTMNHHNRQRFGMMDDHAGS